VALRIPTISLLVTLALVGCSDADDPGGSSPTRAEPASTTPRAEPSANGMKLVVRQSDFGRMLFNARRQAIYIFDNDIKTKPTCYGECAAAWPPVFAKGKPVAGRGVREGLLGTTKRRNGKKQVTYNGRPLYYYAHEGPGEVLCHDVFLNGGYWWVIGPNGKRRP
jgi:predicted lipoprotein with Yx(FWY)xxD motif